MLGRDTVVEKLARVIIRLRYLIIVATLLIVAALGSGVRFIEFTNDYRVFLARIILSSLLSRIFRIRLQKTTMC